MDSSMIRQAIYGTAAPIPATRRYADDGRTPNSRHPVLVYHGNDKATGGLAERLETLFAANDWPPQWRGGVFGYHHYHSVSHETLGVACGSATLMLGGEQGESLVVTAGDVLVLPAGTGHCRIDASADFELVAAYPPDQQDWDLCRPGDTDHAAACARIAAVAIPPQDPVTGAHGALPMAWR